MENRIYLDHAATSPMHPKAAKVMSDALLKTYGNASSIHQIGRESRGYLDEARATFAKSIHAKPAEIILTSGGTESDNMAIIKTAELFEDKGKHIITTNIEHQAIRQPLKYLEAKGFEVTYLPVDKDGLITAKQVEEALREETILVSVMFGNNEVGSLMPIEEIGKLLVEKDILFHTDAVQAYGSQEIDVNQLHVDLLSVSGHKINGPKGIGFLYVREGVSLPSLILGGEQETKRRAGTENIPAVIGFEKAVSIMLDERKSRADYYTSLKKRVVNGLEAKGIDFKVNGKLEPALPHVLSLHLPKVSSEKLLIQLDLAGIALSAGSACTAGNIDPSHVLVAMFGEDAPEIAETIRLSFGLGNTVEEIDRAVDAIAKAVKRLKK
jgi:cysteine desulfurase